MHFGAQLLEPFLMRDAEMLLLVDDDQPEILELDVFAEKRMGADDDIDTAFGDPFFALASSVAETSREACASCSG